MIIRRLGRIGAYRQYLDDEFSASAPSLLWRLRGLWHGHPGRALFMLDPAAYRARDFISFARQRRRESVYNSELSLVLYEKLSQKLWLDKVMPAAAPPVISYLAGDLLIPLQGEEISTRSALAGLVEKHGGLFLKPMDKGRGIGALRLEWRSGAIIANGEPVSAVALAILLSESRFQSYLVSALIQPDRWSDALFPGTLNTMRILTGTRRADRQPLLLAATMKVAAKATGPTDNWRMGKGGIACRVDVRTGILGSGLRHDEKTNRRRFHETHPESSAQLAGAAVPGWAALRATILQLAALLPFPGLVGWDVAFTPTGPVVVELNTTPGLEIHQCLGSIQEMPEQRAYFRELRLI